MIFTKEGFGALKYSLAVFLAGLGVAVFFIAGSYYYWQAERSNETASQRTLGEMRNRLEAAKREQEDFRTSEENYKALVRRGVFAQEQRLELLEAMLTLKQHHRLVRLEYEVGAQRAVKLSNASLSGIDVLGSRIQLKARALHDGDMTAFLDEFPRLRRGLFPLDRCVLKRVDSRSGIGIAPTDQVTRPTSSLATATSATGVPDDLAAGVEAECSLEWLTLLDKRGPVIAANAAATGRPPAPPTSSGAQR